MKRPKIDINSLALSKPKSESYDFTKYDIEAVLDEVQNTETDSILKYSFTILSDPKNIRIAVDGVVKLSGTEVERSGLLESDESNIPNVLNLVYKELFPVFLITTKSMQVPCPPYKLSDISKSAESKEEISEVQEPLTEPELTKTEEPESTKEELREKIIEAVAEEKSENQEQNYEDMSNEKLTEIYNQMSAEYSKNPSEDLRNNMTQISAILTKRSESRDVTESPQI